MNMVLQKAYENIQKVPPGGRLEFTHNPSANTKRSSVEHRSKKKYVRWDVRYFKPLLAGFSS